MVTWTLRFKKMAVKDAERLKAAGLRAKAEVLLDLVAQDPFRVPPPCEKLIGDLAGLFSRRITLKHRLVYEVCPETREIVVFRMSSHYGD